MKNTSGFLLRLLVDPRLPAFPAVRSERNHSVRKFLCRCNRRQPLPGKQCHSECFVARPDLFERICPHTPFIAEK